MDDDGDRVRGEEKICLRRWPEDVFGDKSTMVEPVTELDTTKVQRKQRAKRKDLLWLKPTFPVPLSLVSVSWSVLKLEYLAAKVRLTRLRALSVASNNTPHTAWEST